MWRDWRRRKHPKRRTAEATTTKFWGSMCQLADASGAVLETIKYSPYGTPTIESGSASTDLLYAGQYNDPQSGLVYLRARWYDPTTGQFLSVDPDLAQTGATYNYAGDDPTTDTDPTGLHWWNTVWNVVTTPARLASDGIGWAWYQTGLAGDAQSAADFWANLATSGCSSWAEKLAGNVFGPLAELGTRGNIGATALTLGGGLAGGAADGAADAGASEAAKPPGFDPDTWTQMPGTRVGTGLHWWDPDGGEWGWQDADQYHAAGHWNYNPWTQWNSPWQNIYPGEGGGG